MKFFLLILFVVTSYSQEIICVYDIEHPEFWESTTTIESQGMFKHFETYFIDSVAQYETRDGWERMIYYYYEYPTENIIFFYGGLSISSKKSFCYDPNPLGVENVDFPYLKIYPNPTIKIINIEGIDDFKVIIYDIVGRTIFKGSNMRTINLQNLSSGVYFIKLESDNKIKTSKIIKK